MSGWAARMASTTASASRPALSRTSAAISSLPARCIQHLVHLNPGRVDRAPGSGRQALVGLPVLGARQVAPEVSLALPPRRDHVPASGSGIPPELEAHESGKSLHLTASCPHRRQDLGLGGLVADVDAAMGADQTGCASPH